jgi:hypothetical protein
MNSMARHRSLQKGNGRCKERERGCDATFDMLMGRKKFIQTHAANVRNLDI